MRSFTLAAIFCVLLMVFRFSSSLLTSQFPESIGNFVNLSPFVALFFCSAYYFKKDHWLMPVATIAWFISTPFLNKFHGFGFWNHTTTVQFIALLLILGLGFLFQKKVQFWKVLLGSTMGVVLFYLITNTASFIANPVYVKTPAGYIQALWTGAPSHQIPTWVFFRNSMIGNLLFTSLFMLSIRMPYFKSHRKQAKAVSDAVSA